MYSRFHLPGRIDVTNIAIRHDPVQFESNRNSSCWHGYIMFTNDLSGYLSTGMNTKFLAALIYIHAAFLHRLISLVGVDIW